MTATPTTNAPDPDAPGIHEDVLRRLLAAAESALEPDQLSAETTLRDDLGMTSLESLTLVLELEEHLEIDIEDDELASLGTVGDLLALIDAKHATSGPRPVAG